MFVRINRTIATATEREGHRGVSRGHSSPDESGRRAESSVAGSSREDSMSVERQEGTWYQLSLLEWREGQVRHGAGGEGGTGTAAREESQAVTASERERALTGDLMERIRECGSKGSLASPKGMAR